MGGGMGELETGVLAKGVPRKKKFQEGTNMKACLSKLFESKKWGKGVSERTCSQSQHKINR